MSGWSFWGGWKTRTLACKDSGLGGQRRSSEGFDPLSRSQRMERSLILLRVGDGMGSFLTRSRSRSMVIRYLREVREAFCNYLSGPLESCVLFRGGEGRAVRREGTRDGGPRAGGIATGRSTETFGLTPTGTERRLPHAAGGSGFVASRRVGLLRYLTIPNSARRLSAQACSLLAGSVGISLPKLTVWMRST